MFNHTTVQNNIAHKSMCALALLALHLMKWRHHGIGVLQGYIAENADPEIRLHLWCSDLVKSGISESGDIHDHRFYMVSHVLCGSVLHEVIKHFPHENGDYRMLALTHARAAADNKFHGPTEELPGKFGIERMMTRISSGKTYTFPPGIFHRSPVVHDSQVTVTVVEKYDQQNTQARVLYPAHTPPVMAFGHEIDAQLIDSVVLRAKLRLQRELGM